MASDLTVIGGFAAATVVASLFIKYRNWRALPVPPGPKPWPFVGNITDLRPLELWVAAREWSQQYGEIVYTHLFGKGIIFLNNLDVVNDLLDKRAAIYSDKPRLVMVNELCGVGNMVVFTNYGDKARRQRRLMSHTLSAFHVPRQHQILESEARNMIGRFLEGGDAFAHLRRYAVAIIVRIVYGVDIRDDDGSMKFLELEEDTTELLANEITSRGGVWAVDMIPWLKHIPSWFPGAGFKRKANVWKKQFDELRELPWATMKANMAAGKAPSSFCSELLTQSGKALSQQDETDIKDTANSMYSASMDTTVVIISHFLIQMMKHPEIQEKAHAELDRVLGGRLPTFADRDNLPYITAVFEESLRWACPVPLSLPHCLLEDDEYKGMHLPKGSIVFANIWKIVRDDNIYPNPETFDPERFVEKGDGSYNTKQADPRQFVFGFGRRRCPGVHLGTTSVWFLIASLLATLDIRMPLDSDGKPIEPNVTFENSIFRTPSDFKVDMKPRSGAKAAFQSSAPLTSP
ncbi:cytochrome P450 monooxygenase 45 [Heterobasidion irregulare TC 32-1]|uniref:Cytochrome P450 monooxygenase 45 n=1 Tax=Heterobasidion irregulare (strain TC 32-1) TaxID=747525 RepID=W4JS06_HETIT|nr:cytochrome P450 monooxygenase 45 [Heterobasidion irregulare TC 32-1]ETW75666.1 cytochrome P450 monooxygenase 45 [Heterobasidion irregulare TC 32-1]